MDFVPLSLDIETSTSDLDGQILSIGVVRFDNGENRYIEIRHEKLVVSPESMAVNRFNVTTLNDNKKYYLHLADPLLQAFLTQYEEGTQIIVHGAATSNIIKEVKFIPMGFNVGSFDMSFVRKYLPMTAEKLGYRSIDLNALIFAEAYKTGKNFYNLKRSYKKSAFDCAKKHASELEPHHALFDCYIASGVFSLLTGIKPSWL